MIKKVVLFFITILILVSCNLGSSSSSTPSSDCKLNPVYDPKQHVCLNANPPLPIKELYIFYVSGSAGGDNDIQIPVGGSLQFYALAQYQDGLYYDVTDKVDWVTNTYSLIPHIYHWDIVNAGRLIADGWGDVFVQGSLDGTFSHFVNVHAR